MFSLLRCTPLVNWYSFFPDRAYTIHPDDLPENVHHLFIKSSGRVTIEVFHLPCSASKRILIYFHGNGGNIAQRLPDLIRLHKNGIAVFGVGYRGYGRSSGRPSEKGIYRDGEAALQYVRDSLGYREEDIFLLGRSIGSTVAINTARKRSLAGIILITPLSSGNDHARAHGLGWLTFLSGNCFDNIGKVPKMVAPVLVIHGTKDEVVPYRLGKKLYDVLPVKKRMVTIRGGDHNNLEYVDPYLFWMSIDRFLIGG